jgi:dihydroorotate dehydrogenase
MPGLTYATFRRHLFRLDPERAHNLTLGLLRLAGWFPPSRIWMRRTFGTAPVGPEVRAMGLRFQNPLGLAAGYDKDGLALTGLACLGFGHIEFGAVTPLPQPGRDRPRVFRLEPDGALINRMGFPNRGADALVRRLGRARRPGLVVGVNLGLGAKTPIEAAADDYCAVLQAVAEVADFVTLNLSSPNTPGLRTLQTGERLRTLLEAVTEARQRASARRGRHLPMTVKLAPDLDPADMEEAVRTAIRFGVEAVTAVNTTRRREGLISPRQHEDGGLSGRPLWPESRRQVGLVREWAGDNACVIGVGGIDSPSRAREMLDTGADLVQVYTGLVYQGPGLPSSILRGLSAAGGAYL